jgi:hypothetical protein
LCRWIQAEVGITNRLLDLGAHAFFPRRHADRARIEQRHVGNLADGHHGAVIVDMDGVQQAGVGTARANLGQSILERIKGLLHFLVCMLLDFNNTHTRISGFLGTKDAVNQ